METCRFFSISSKDGSSYHFKIDGGHYLDMIERHPLLGLQVRRFGVSRRVSFEEIDNFVELIFSRKIRSYHAEAVVVSENWLKLKRILDFKFS